MIGFPKYFCVLFVVSISISAQNKQLLYGFQEIPQSLLQNPGSETPFTKHIGIPLLSGIYINGGTNNSLISKLFSNDGVAINTKLRNIIHQLDTGDFISVNEQLDIFNVGFQRSNDKDYVSIGFYQEADFTAYYPKDIALLFYEGNTDGNGNIDLSKSYDMSSLWYRGDVIGVFHVGISRRMNEKLTVGARGKVYSGIFNVQSLNNKGTISTRLDQNNAYQHLLTNFDATLRSSGFTKTARETLIGDALKNLFIGGNIGLGVDLGFTYNIRENIKVSGSMLDMGFITYSNKVITYKVKGDFEVNNLGLLDPPAEETFSYWEALSNDFNAQVDREISHKTYLTLRPLKLNGALNYGFGKQVRKYKRATACPTFNNTATANYQNEIGVQLYSIFRLSRPQIATTLFYSRSVSDFLKAKITYTADSYTFSNIGLGFSAQFGKFNIYATADNLLGYKDIYNAKKIGAQFGMNLIFDR